MHNNTYCKQTGCGGKGGGGGELGIGLLSVCLPFILAPSHTIKYKMLTLGDKS